MIFVSNEVLVPHVLTVIMSPVPVKRCQTDRNPGTCDWQGMFRSRVAATLLPKNVSSQTSAMAFAHSSWMGLYRQSISAVQPGRVTVGSLRNWNVRHPPGSVATNVPGNVVP